MAINHHIISYIGGSSPMNFGDRLELGVVKALAYGAGPGAGGTVNVTLPFALTPGDVVLIGALPAGVAASIAGNVLTVGPTNSANTLAAGSLAVLVVR